MNWPHAHEFQILALADVYILYVYVYEDYEMTVKKKLYYIYRIVLIWTQRHTGTRTRRFVQQCGITPTRPIMLLMVYTALHIFFITELKLQSW